jgi:hypothetical protein
MGVVAKTNVSANSQLNLSEKQMLMLSTYAYEINADNLRSVEENLDSMKTNGLFDATKVKSVESGVKPSEFIKVFKDMDKDDIISDLVVVDSIDGYIRAMCLVPSNQVDKKNAEAVIVFLGTKGNNEAWLDNFEGAYNEDTELQLVAGRFFDKVSKKYKVTNVTGHSKGGNLAVYATAKCRENIQDKISKVYSHDGPGFLEDTLNSPEFQKIASRIENTLPRSSVIGMMLEHRENFEIVKSNTLGLLQHDQFTWEIENNSFIYIDNLTKNARFTDKTLTDWLHQLTEEERERFVDALYSVLNTNHLTNIDDFKSDWQTAIPATVHAISQLDGDTKKFILHTLKKLASLGLKNVTIFGKD